MRLALIDLGTNAVRFDVQELSPASPPRRLHRERLMIRLGDGVFRTGRLSPEAMARASSAFRSFARTCRDLRVDRTTAFGTSALREASNADALVNRIRRETGIEMRVISGAEEARLIAEGVLRREKISKGTAALVDVGGGSVEIILCRRRRIGRAVSMDLGVARLRQVFLKTIPPRPEALEALRRHVREALRSAAPRGGWPVAKEIVGSGGTIRALATIWEKEPEGGGRFNAKDLERMTERLSELSYHRLLRVPGMEPHRADVITAGAALLTEIAEALCARTIRPTDYALRDGMLEEELRLHGRGGNGGSPAPGFDEKALVDLAVRLNGDRMRLNGAAALADALFDRLQDLHGLAPAWRQRLAAAAILRDAGKAVSRVHSERHSAYVALHADIPFLEPWEKEFVSQLCLWHKRGKVEPEEVPFWKDKVRRTAFLKLLAILRLVEALDHGRSRPVLTGVRRVGRRLSLALKGVAELELLRLDQKKDLFEKTFRVSLSARPA